MILKKRYFVRKDHVSEVREKMGSFLDAYPDLWPEGADVEIIETDEDTSFILINRQPVFFQKDEKCFPLLKAVLDLKLNNKTVVVDEGAVRFVVNGADIMRPGIVGFDRDLLEGDAVVVLEVKHKKPLAIGMSLLDAEDFAAEKSGKAVKNVHFVGDQIWGVVEKL